MRITYGPAGRPPPARPRSAVGASLALLALLLPAGAALAQQSRGVALRWEAPPSCPAGAEVLSKMDDLLEGRPATAAKPIEVRAQVAEEEGGGWVVRLEILPRGEGGDGPRVREVRGASCAALGSATAVILALMIDPLAMAARTTGGDPAAAPQLAAPQPAAPSPSPISPEAASPSPSTPSPASPQPAAPQTASPQSAAPSPPSPGLAPATAPALYQPPPPAKPGARPAAPDLSFRATGWIGMDVGSLPHATPGLGVLGALHAGRQRFELGVAVWPARAAPLPGTEAGTLQAGIVAGNAGTCRMLLTGRVELAPCVGVEIGGAYAETFGVPTPGEATTLWAAMRAGGSVAWMPQDGAGLVARLEAVVPVAGPTFVLQGVGPVHEAAPIGGRGSVGVEVRF